MKINLNVIFTLLAAIIFGLIAWNVYLFRNNNALVKEKSSLEEKYHYLDSFNEVVKYDLVTARDSLRILKEELESVKSQTISDQ